MMRIGLLLGILAATLINFPLAAWAGAWIGNSLNTKSRNAARRLGYRFEGVFYNHMIVKGRNRDTAWYSMLDHEWPARKRAFEEWLKPANFDPDGKQQRPLSDFMPDAGS